MKRLIVSTAVFLLFLTAAAGRAQKLSDQPGYVSIEDLNLFPREDLSVEINLDGAILRMVAEATRGDDPEFAKVMSGLKAIQVRVFPLAGAREDLVRGKIERAVRWLEDRGWSSMVRVREKGDESYIYLKKSGEQIVGLTILAIEAGDEAAMINIVGQLDPAEIGRLGQSFDIPQLEKVHPRKPEKPE
ncbi:MAG TPA: DUF4252 domain-containing protein [Thermoanaerobaculia bacterium]